MNDCSPIPSRFIFPRSKSAVTRALESRSARLLLGAALLSAASSVALIAQQAGVPGASTAAPVLPDSSSQQLASDANADRLPGNLPDAPQSGTAPATAQKPAQTPEQAQAQALSDRAPQTKRILGIIPNFRSISTDEKVPPQTVKDKFVTASEDSFDYSSIVIPAMLAGYSLGTNATPEFGHGGVGYGRYLWHSAVDQTSENYMVEFIVPSITHEDTRYYTLARGSFLKRTVYSLSRAVVTRSDSGREEFNFSEVVGAGASAGLSTLYYPSRERSLGNTGKQWGLDVGIDGASFFVKEFWPDINHWLFHGAKPVQTPAPQK